MGEPMNYDEIAADYAQGRWAFPWVLEPLTRRARDLPPNSNVLEVGCGTGNYVSALANEFPEHSFFGFDQSKAMLAVAQSRSETVSFCLADAEHAFPYADRSFDLAFLVDVVHHIKNLRNLFEQCSRVMKPEGLLLIVTDSEQNIRNRSLTTFFPELLEIELRRYPRVDELHSAVRLAGLDVGGAEPAEGFIDLNDEFIAKLEQRCSSGMRLITHAAHERGIKRVREAQAKGQRWYSCYTVLSFGRAGVITAAATVASDSA